MTWWIHLHSFPAQVLMVSTDKPEDWITLCTSALKNASTRFKTTDTVNAFSLFDSSPYCAKTSGDDSQADDQDSNEYKWMKNKDLIFKDRSSSLLSLPEVKSSCLVSLAIGFFFQHQIPRGQGMI